MNFGKPYVSLGIYYPGNLVHLTFKKGSGNKKRFAKKIGLNLLEKTKQLGYRPLANEEIQRNANPIWFSLKDHAEVRSKCEPISQGTDWHQDGDTSVSREEMDFGLIVWASRDPTEIKFNNEVYQPKPFEIVYINNLQCYHRRPPGLSGSRWHFRQRVMRSN